MSYGILIFGLIFLVFILALLGTHKGLALPDVALCILAIAVIGLMVYSQVHHT